MTTSITHFVRFRPRRRAEPPPSLMQPMEPIVWNETGGWSVTMSKTSRRTHSRAPRGCADTRTSAVTTL